LHFELPNPGTSLADLTRRANEARNALVCSVPIKATRINMKTLVISSLCSAFLMAPALAQMPPAPPTAPPAPLPPASAPFDQQVDVTGTIKAFTLTPIGEIEGMILTNGTEIHVPPHLTEQVVSAVHPGEAVAVRGWNTGVPNFVVATAVTGQRGQSVVDQGPPPPGMRPPPPPPGQPAPGAQMATVRGRILQILHGPRSDANGALLDDGTTLKFPPPTAWPTASLLRPGQAVVAQGWSLSNSYGRVVDVQSIASAQQAGPPSPAASAVLPPPPPPAAMAPPPPAPPRG
jgi:hypothetical protein